MSNIYKNDFKENEILLQLKEISEIKMKENKPISNKEDVALLLGYVFDSEIEIFNVLYLDASNRVIDILKIDGDPNKVDVSLRVIVINALSTNCVSIIISHNHPANTISFSDSDINLTKIVFKAVSLFNIDLLDHVLLAKSGVVSLRDSCKWHSLKN